MKNFKNYIINLDKNKLFLIQGFLLIIMIISNFNTEQKLINGYQFFFFLFPTSHRYNFSDSYVKGYF